VYICVQGTEASQAYQTFCNGDINDGCNGALLAVSLIEECATAINEDGEGTIPRANLSAILCTGATCSRLTRNARNACNGINDEVSYCCFNFCSTSMHIVE